MVETRFTQTPVILNHLMMLPIEKALGKVSVVGAVVYCLELPLGPRHSFTPLIALCWREQPSQVCPVFEDGLYELTRWYRSSKPVLLASAGPSKLRAPCRNSQHVPLPNAASLTLLKCSPEHSPIKVPAHKFQCQSLVPQEFNSRQLIVVLHLCVLHWV